VRSLDESDQRKTLDKSYLASNKLFRWKEKL